ncbi:MAG TPA: hypothetical protein PLA50_11150, partial [Bacteroidia bacterium]|nr:hypothetical protein [Bacteroidia bacterium]
MKRMTERSFAIAAIGLALAASPTSAEQTLPPGAEALINRAAEKSASLLMTAIDLANREAKSDKNFVVFLKELKKYGFGAPVAMPPWANVPEHEDPDAPKKELTEEERKEKERKHAEMVEASRKRVGTFEINYFKEIDKNHDTKTDAEEISKAIRDYLIFELNDRLINIDGNKDGKLSLQEYALSVPAQGKVGSDGVDWHQREHFEEEDKDGSGFIEMEEVIGGYISRIHMR